LNNYEYLGISAIKSVACSVFMSYSGINSRGSTAASSPGFICRGRMNPATMHNSRFGRLVNFSLAPRHPRTSAKHEPCDRSLLACLCRMKFGSDGDIPPRLVICPCVMSNSARKGDFVHNLDGANPPPRWDLFP